MKLTKIDRRELKCGDLYCSICGSFDCPVFVARYSGEKEITKLRDLHVLRIDMQNGRIKELERINASLTTQIKGIADDDVILYDANKKAAQDIERFKVEINDLVRENDGLEEDKKRMYAIMDRQRVTMGQQMDDVVELRMKIFDIEGREDLVTTELERQIKDLSSKLAECRDKFVGRGDDSPITRMRRHISELREMSDIDERAWKKRESELLEMITARDEELAKCCDERDHDKRDLELLNMLLKRANPMIRTGMWRTTVGSCEFMRDVCQDVIDFRRKYNIVG